ncbi:MAG: flippase-like domain-containing protein [Endomicrobiales bacterium]|nr:flippase-like domain-containing protein [Endomicrobiales bacterium]
MKKIFKLSIGLTVSILFLWLAFRKADIKEVLTIILNADMGFLFLAFVLSVFSLMLRSYRWKFLGREYENVPWKYFFKATAMGLTLNAFLPFRSGDIFQGYYLSLKSNMSKSYVFTTVILERIMDFIPPVLMLIVSSYFIVLPRQVKTGALILVFALVVAGIISFIKFNYIFKHYINKIGFIRNNEKIRRILKTMNETILFLKDRQVITKVIPLTLGNWVFLTATVTFLLLRSIDIQLAFWNVFLILAITVLSVAIPSSPGYVGTWEFFCLFALGIFNVGRERALSFAVLSHFMAFFPVLVFGIYYLLYEVFVEKFRIKLAGEIELVEKK